VDRRNNWVDHFGMSNEQIHCSGHASRSDLFGIVQEINADVLYPIHSGSPKEYDGVVKNIVYPEYAKRYEL
jgi:mRNA degradation ribonuclease J1/J2